MIDDVARERARAFIAGKRRELERLRADVARIEGEIAELESRGKERKARYALAGRGPNVGSMMWRAREALRRHGGALTVREILHAMGVEPTDRAIHALRSAMYKHIAAGTTFVRVARGRYAAHSGRGA